MDSDSVVRTKPDPDWRYVMKLAVELYLRQAVLKHGQDHSVVLEHDHIASTPDRVVQAFSDYVKGCMVSPALYLQPLFSTGNYDEMIHIRSVKVFSLCAHHLCPIIGKAHFAYVPDGKIVGLSKIPRMIDCLSRRPQVQESLTQQIVDVFQEGVKPLGCGVNIRAYHLCVLGRGVEERASFTETTAIRGCFKENELARQEFLQSVDRIEAIFP